MNVVIWWKIISSRGVEIYFVISISLTEWGLPTEISSWFLHTYDHLTRCRAIDPDSIRFCDFHNSMIDFSSDDLIFFSTHKFHLYVEMSNLLNLKKVFSTYIYIYGWETNFFQHQCVHWFNQHVHTIFPIFTHCLIQNQIT